mmetsp:Transcript_114682/g.199455  ORF Transcript_114682/g.199455 Transcript_114682/m.199455 type:complete len:227 (-) Transcript_114682:969-1649(-)
MPLDGCLIRAERHDTGVRDGPVVIVGMIEMMQYDTQVRQDGLLHFGLRVLYKSQEGIPQAGQSLVSKYVTDLVKAGGHPPPRLHAGVLAQGLEGGGQVEGVLPGPEALDDCRKVVGAQASPNAGLGVLVIALCLGLEEVTEDQRVLLSCQFGRELPQKFAKQAEQQVQAPCRWGSDVSLDQGQNEFPPVRLVEEVNHLDHALESGIGHILFLIRKQLLEFLCNQLF